VCGESASKRGSPGVRETRRVRVRSARRARSLTSASAISSRCGLFALAVGVAALGLVSCGEAGEGPSHPPRIILVSMDTVRADHVGAVATTPALAGIAGQGVTLQNFYAASSFTLPSHMSIFTGLDPIEHGVWREEAELNPNVSTLAEILRADGYQTAAFHEGGYVAPRYGFGRGFETYTEFPRVDVVDGSLSMVTDWIRDHSGDRYFLFVHTYAAHYPYGGWERYRRAGGAAGRLDDSDLPGLRQRWNEAHARRQEGRAPEEVPLAVRSRCTLYNQLAETHAALLGCGDNFLSIETLDSEYAAADLAAILDGYDARIGQIDRALAQIRKTLERLGEWDDTLLVITADHGEAFLEHGTAQHDYVPFDEVMRVPAVLSYPRLLRAGGVREIEESTWHLDLMPTILGLAGIEFPGRSRGVDLSSVLRGESSLRPDRTVHPAVLRLAHREPKPPRRVAVRGRLKYIEGDAAFGDERGLLFDLGEDPGEVQNLRASRADDFRALEDSTTAWRAALEPQPARHRESGRLLSTDPEVTVPEIELSPRQRQTLKELGYVD